MGATGLRNRVLRLFLILLALAAPAVGQFAGLGSTADGSTLYFSTPLRLRGSNSPFTYKILRQDTRLTEFLSRDLGDPIGWTWSNFYDLMAAQPSSDGSVIAISARRLCGGGSGCLSVQTAQGSIVDRAGKQLFSDLGSVSMSPNGRWALFYARNTFGTLVTASELVDLSNGQTTKMPYSFQQRARRVVANDGTVAVIAGSELHLWRTDSEQTLAGASPLQATYSNDPIVLISADGRKIVYQTASGLAIYDRGSSAEITLSATPVTSATISDDAATVAFVSASDSQVWLASPLRRLSSEADGITEVALSGNGQVAFAATTGGRLLRIDVPGAAVTELIPRTPWITSFQQPIVPGSLYWFSGRNLAPAQVRIAGLDAPVQSAAADQVWFQTPWETPVQDSAPVELVSGNSPLESPPGAVAVAERSPGNFTTDLTFLAVHQDWSGLVTPDRPAAGGEVIAVYLNGLGPVTPRVATGAVGPVPPAAITGALRCQFWDGGPNDGQIFFAGLAPGMLGVYQLSVQVPAGLRLSPVSLSCDFGTDTTPVFGLLPIKL
jgi:uncharacterized protein (TIGR03437 family)